MRTSPNLFSSRNDCPAPRDTVFWKSRVTCSCPGVAPDADPTTRPSRAVEQSSERTLRHFLGNTFRLRAVKQTGPLIAFPPKLPPACAAFPDTSPAADSANVHLT